MSGEPTPNRARLLTPPGRGAVAVVAASGAAAIAAIDARFRAANGKPLADQPLDRIVFGHWHEGEHAEEVVVCRTGDAEVEVHCHGGVAAAGRILAALADAGCGPDPSAARHSAPSSWPRGGLASEAELALASAPTRRTAAILLDQHAGALQREIDAIRGEIAAGGEDAPARFDEARRRLAVIAERAQLGLHLTRPWHVALAGAPNVGKSSLLNAILGYGRAIVFDQPGTTRDVLDAATAIDGWPVRLTDGAGLRESADALEAAGVARARDELAQADLVAWVLDATTLAPADFADAAHIVRRACAAELGKADDTSVPLLAIVNKTDLVPLNAADRLAMGDSSYIFVSAFTGAGLDELLAAIARRLVPVPPAPGDAVPFTPRQAELITAAIERLDAGDAPGAVAALDRVSLGNV